MTSNGQQTNSFAVNQVNKLLGRVFSVAAPIIGLQMFVNAFSQAYLLQPIWFGVAIGCMFVIFTGGLISVWFFNNSEFWFRALTIATLAIMVTWELQVQPNAQIPSGFQPWIWWAAGIAAISAFVGFSVFWAALFSVLIPAAYFVVHLRELGGGADLLTVAQDVALTVLFAGTISSLGLVLRYEASKVDLANGRATEATILAATSAAADAERARVDALVHDSVLTTLLVAAKAQSPEEEKAAADLAAVAIQKLTLAQSDSQRPDTNISVSSLLSALEESIRGGFPSVKVDAQGANDDQIPEVVAAALTGATLQAVSNSITHAGASAQRIVMLRAAKSRIKIVVKDDGRGFRPARVIKSRLGLKLSVIDRVEAVGGRVYIDAKPGIGATIVIEWSRS
jgi:signal transduction histidine kinase